MSIAGGSNIYDAIYNPTGTDYAIRCYSGLNKAAYAKTVSFEFDDVAGYSNAYS